MIEKGRIEKTELAGSDPEKKKPKRLFEIAPLPQDAVEAMSGQDCLHAIEERYQLALRQLFQKAVIDDPDRLWNLDELAKIALFRLEGVSASQIASFYSYEYHLLLRKPEYLALAPSIQRICSLTFSPVLKERIAERVQYVHSIEGLAAQDPEIERVVSQIEDETGLPRDRIFTRSRFADGGLFTPLQVLRSYLVRIRGGTEVKDILIAFEHDYLEDKKNIEKLAMRIQAQWNKKFTPEARALIRKKKR